MKILSVVPFCLDAFQLDVFKQLFSLTLSQLEVSYDTMFKTADYDRIE
jgi:hypothetical protein